MVRAPVRQIVACDRRNHDVLQPETEGGFGHALRFILGRTLRLTASHGTETARTRANLAENHERRRLLRVAFHAVGAFGLFANRGQLQFVEQSRRQVVGVAFGNLPLQPSRQTRWRCHSTRGRLQNGQGRSRRRFGGVLHETRKTKTGRGGNVEDLPRALPHVVGCEAIAEREGNRAAVHAASRLRELVPDALYRRRPDPTRAGSHPGGRSSGPASGPRRSPEWPTII